MGLPFTFQGCQNILFILNQFYRLEETGHESFL
jgi:hypothetical protein